MELIGTRILDAVSLYAPTQDLSALASFAALAPTVTPPTGNGVFALNLVSGAGTNNCELAFFGGAAADQTFDARVWLWRRLGAMYYPVWLIDVTCTLGTTTGVSGAGVTNSHLFADTITSGATPNSVELISPANNLVASLLVDTRGANAIQVQFEQGESSTASTAGAIVTQL